MEARDIDAAISLLADDVLFRSPVVFKPYRGRGSVAPLLIAVSRVFEGFRYVRELGAPGTSDHALLFEARVGDRELQGCDFLHTNAAGLIDELMVIVRPLTAALALAEAMQRELGSSTGEVARTPDQRAARSPR
ncbi:MAG TPA: nuclear transport factor 2 family protein [Solirubrobacteraceae bacterium]|nr:nuclear transport factor 2 family protein [Solirubrobacteraceae bacterium]